MTHYQANGPLRPWFGLLSAARIYLEQFRPEDVLALGRRHDHPWAAGLRGAAYLLLHREAEGEKEFDGLAVRSRPSWATMLRNRRWNSTVCRQRCTRDASTV